MTSNIFYEATYNEWSDYASEAFVDICDGLYLSCDFYCEDKLVRSALTLVLTAECVRRAL